MQDNHWAELLTKNPGRTVARYKPSSPRARVGGPPVASAARDQSSLGSQRTTSTVPTSASGSTSSSNSDATHNDQRRGGDSALHGQTRIEHLTRSASLGSEDSLSAAHVLKNKLQSSTSRGGEAPRFAQKQRSHVTKQRGAMGHAREPHAVTSHQRTMSRSASQSATKAKSSLGSLRPTSTHPTSASGSTSSSNNDASQSDERRDRTGALGQTRSDHTHLALTRSASLGSEDGLSAAHVLKNELQSSTSRGGEASRFAQKQRSHVTRQPTALGHAQEPQADTSHQRTMRLKAHHATSTQKGKTSHIFCGNNILSPKLRRNGGDMEIGSPSQCFRKGFGAGFYQEIEPAHLEEFLADNSGPYRRYIEQPLFYGDGPVPAGKIRATLSQCRSRGFGVGAMQRAKKILKERKHGMSKAR